MNIRAELVTDLRRELASALIALDFDGTLAPLVPDPQDSRLVDGIRVALDDLVAAGARVAVVTGRDISSVLRLSGLADLPGLHVEGVYGAQSWHDGLLHTVDAPEALGALRSRLPAVVEDEPRAGDVWIEDKHLSLVVHARRAADPQAVLDVLSARVTALAGELGLETHPGREVLEIRIPGFDKGTALSRLIALHRPRAVLYIGDDVGDVPAFDLVRTLRTELAAAYAVGVGGAEIPEVAAAVDLSVEDPDAVAELLRDIAARG